jgi:hypothetical protein
MKFVKHLKEKREELEKLVDSVPKIEDAILQPNKFKGLTNEQICDELENQQYKYKEN